MEQKLQGEIFSPRGRGQDLNSKVRRSLVTLHIDIEIMTKYDQVRLHHGIVVPVKPHIERGQEDMAGHAVTVSAFTKKYI